VKTNINKEVVIKSKVKSMKLIKYFHMGDFTVAVDVAVLSTTEANSIIYSSCAKWKQHTHTKHVLREKLNFCLSKKNGKAKNSEQIVPSQPFLPHNFPTFFCCHSAVGVFYEVP